MANKVKIHPGQLYAVTAGDYFGCNIVCINVHNNSVMFLELNEMKNMDIDKSDVTSGVAHGVLELLDTLPDDIMDTCIKQYEKNTNN